MHVGFEHRDQPRRTAVVKDHHVRNAANRGDDFRALAFIRHGPPLAFQRAHRFVAVDADDEDVGLLRGILQIANMSDVKHIEHSVRKRDRLSGCTFIVCHALEKLGFGEDGRVHDFNSSSRSIA